MRIQCYLCGDPCIQSDPPKRHNIYYRQLDTGAVQAAAPGQPHMRVAHVRNRTPMPVNHWRAFVLDQATFAALDQCMIAILEERRAELKALCQKHGVLRLDLVGSATRADFQEAGSDLDFVVEFADLSPKEHAQHYFALIEELEALFLRPVDLIEWRAIRNPYLKESLANSRVPVYAAG